MHVTAGLAVRRRVVLQQTPTRSARATTDVPARYISVALGACDFFKRNGDQLVERYVAAEAVPGPCTVLGYGTKTIPTLAAFANGTLAEALDFQDSQMDVLTHNGTPIIPAVIAMAEKLSAPWRNIATAIIAGYERIRGCFARSNRVIGTGVSKASAHSAPAAPQSRSANCSGSMPGK